MDTDNAMIAHRVKSAMDEAGMTQRDLAARLGLDPSKMSRALNAQRSFSSGELATAADVLSVDLHWLITGEADPLALCVAARMKYDHSTGERTNPDRASDDGLLKSIALVYRQVWEAATTPRQLPSDPEAMRDRLGADFVRHFADRIEENLGVDVIRIPKIGTAYSLRIGERPVIVLPATQQWFYSNFSLAHELGHLALGHHDVDCDNGKDEAPANGFAAELLLPESLMRSIDWQTMSEAELARFLWVQGVSGKMIGIRLSALGLSASAQIRTMLDKPMPGALRRFQQDLGEPVRTEGRFAVVYDPINERLQASATRRFPRALVAAHRQAVEKGRVGPASLAWMLDTTVEDVADAAQIPSQGSVDDLMADLGL